MKKVNFGRVITAMVTPFQENLEVDYEKFEKLCVKLVKDGSDSLLVAGTTGESPTLTCEEEFELFKLAKKTVGDKVKIIAGTGSNSTETAIKSTREAEKIGVDGALVVVPYYNKPPQEALYQHFKKVAENTSLPIIIYNIPGRTGINISADTISCLSEIKNIAGVKESTGNLTQTAEIIKKTPPDFLFYSGDDDTTLPMLSVGAVGVISVASHLVGQEIKKMILSYFEGKVEVAKKIHLKLLPLFRVLFITTNPMCVKAALKLTGFDVGGLRLPLIPANNEEIEKIRKVLVELRLIK